MYKHHVCWWKPPFVLLIEICLANRAIMLFWNRLQQLCSILHLWLVWKWTIEIRPVTAGGCYLHWNSSWLALNSVISLLTLSPGYNVLCYANNRAHIDKQSEIILNWLMHQLITKNAAINEYRNSDWIAVYEFQLRLHSKLMVNPNTTANITTFKFLATV